MQGFKSKPGFVTTGIPSFDVYLGGGLPLNSLTVVEEDKHNVFSKMFLRCLLSSCIHKQYRVIYVSMSNEYSTFAEIASKLPSHTKIKDTEIHTSRSRLESNMKIAWRYTNVSPVAAIPANECEAFDFGRNLVIPETMTERCVLFSLTDCFKYLQEMKGSESNATLVLIESLNFPSSGMNENDLLNCIYKLKSFCRHLEGVTFLISTKPQLMSMKIRKYICNIADCVYEIVDFANTNTPYTDFQGLINIKKLSNINSLNFRSNCETLEIGFQMKKNNRFLVVDKLCLPPDISETASRTTACHTHKNTMDF